MFDVLLAFGEKVGPKIGGFLVKFAYAFCVFLMVITALLYAIATKINWNLLLHKFFRFIDVSARMIKV